MIQKIIFAKLNTNIINIKYFKNVSLTNLLEDKKLTIMEVDQKWVDDLIEIKKNKAKFLEKQMYEILAKHRDKELKLISNLITTYVPQNHVAVRLVDENCTQIYFSAPLKVIRLMGLEKNNVDTISWMINYHTLGTKKMRWKKKLKRYKICLSR